MESISKSSEPIIALFQMQEKYFEKALAEITDVDAQRSVTENTNHIAWLAGHIVSCRYMLCNLIGLQEVEPFPEFFENLKGIDRDVQYPGLENIQDRWSYISSKLIDKLRIMKTADFEKEVFGSKIIDVILFFSYHEAYHIGQIGLTRKAFGYNPLQHNE